MSEPHVTVAVQVWADIDVGIADFVRELNDIPDVRTHACCQGAAGDGGYGPYVMVSWHTPEALAALQRFPMTEVYDGHGKVHPL